MTNNEFIFWLKGFVDAFEGKKSPDENQWDVLKEKIKEIEEEQPDIWVEPQPFPFYPSWPINQPYYLHIPENICTTNSNLTDSVSTVNVTYNVKVPSTLT